MLKKRMNDTFSSVIHKKIWKCVSCMHDLGLYLCHSSISLFHYYEVVTLFFKCNFTVVRNMT
jgi:hypothetical protein